MIISRGIGKYVTECTIDHVDAMLDDIPFVSSVKSVALVKYQGQKKTRTFRWVRENGFAFQRFSIQKKIASRQRKRWRIYFVIFRNFDKKMTLSNVRFRTFSQDVSRWRRQKWNDRLKRDSNKARFEYCLNSEWDSISRALQRHSRGVLLDQNYQVMLKYHMIGLTIFIMSDHRGITDPWSEQVCSQMGSVETDEDKHTSPQRWIRWKSTEKLHHSQLIHQDLFLAKSIGNIIEKQFIDFIWRSHNFFRKVLR